jgi:hypothetical protein
VIPRESCLHPDDKTGKVGNKGVRAPEQQGREEGARVSTSSLPAVDPAVSPAAASVPRSRRPWGSLATGRSRISYLRKRILAELAAEYDVAGRPFHRRQLEDAADLLALVTMMKTQLGIDKTVTVRKITATTMAAQRVLANLSKNGVAKPASPDGEPATIEQYLAQRAARASSVPPDEAGLR